MTERTLEERYTTWVLAVVTGLAAWALASLYARQARAVAEVEWLEQIPVLDVDP